MLQQLEVLRQDPEYSDFYVQWSDPDFKRIARSPFLQEMKAISLGFSDHGSPEEMAEQDRRWAEILRQEEEAKRKQTASSRLL